MNQKRTVYYIAFPVFIFMLCLFSYQLGFKRGVSHLKNEQISRVLEELDKPITENETGKLTYYQELNDNKNPIVAQVKENEKKKAAGTTTTVTVIKPETSSTPVQPSLVVNADKQMAAIQVGAFTDLGKADELTDRLKNAGFEAFTKPIQSKGNELFRVLVRSSKSELASTQAKLEGQGYKGTFPVSK
ncbi:MAG: SPOR domain-containing protein [Bdellovibrionota bacterium]